VLGILDQGVFSGPTLFRTSGPLTVICIESFRRDDIDLSRRVLDRLRASDHTHWTFLAAGFLGRVPWAGYPYPDW
jgi:hypothetical protein